MLEYSGFFDSPRGDPRYYSAEQVTIPFRHLVSNGVQTGGTALMVIPGSSALTVQVLPGKAWVEGRFYLLMVDPDLPVEALTLNLPQAAINPYVARVVLRMNKSEEIGGRHVRPGIIVGEEAVTPVPPPLVREDDIYDLCLAEVTIYPATSLIAPTDIKDTRFNFDLCGVADFAPRMAFTAQVAQGLAQFYAAEITLAQDKWELVNAAEYPEHVGEYVQYWPSMPGEDTVDDHIYEDCYGFFDVDYELRRQGYLMPNDCITMTGRCAFFYSIIPDVAIKGIGQFYRGGQPLNG